MTTGRIEVLSSTPSTQTEALAAVASGDVPAVYVAMEQTAGFGRFGRAWHSPPETSLAASIVQPAGEQPWLMGMAMALLIAEEFDLQVRWPNDLILNDRKVGGILTQLAQDRRRGSWAVIGVGLNLGPMTFPPELAQVATSLARERGEAPPFMEALLQILDGMHRWFPVTGWESLAPTWAERDDTPGKRFRLPTGEESVAIGVTNDGALRCQTAEGERIVLAADALFGPD